MPRYMKRDYENVATIIKEVRDAPGGFKPDIRGATLDLVTAKFVLLFTRDNARFNSKRFREATGEIIA